MGQHRAALRAKARRSAAVRRGLLWPIIVLFAGIGGIQYRARMARFRKAIEPMFANWRGGFFADVICPVITPQGSTEATVDDKHEFCPGGRHIDEVEEADCCARCGNSEAHEDHKNSDGTPYYDTDTIFDRMRYDGSIAPRTT